MFSLSFNRLQGYRSFFFKFLPFKAFNCGIKQPFIRLKSEVSRQSEEIQFDFNLLEEDNTLPQEESSNTAISSLEKSNFLLETVKLKTIFDVN